MALAARGTYANPDNPTLFAFDWTACSGDGTWECQTEDVYIYQALTPTPPGEASKVAWLDTEDVSNNDMVPRLLQGRANLQIFGPFASYGALGSDVNIPPFMPDWHEGTIAASDGRYGATIPDAEGATGWQSGQGVVPDQVVTQKLSDVLTGTDTMVVAAKAWLAQ